MSTLAKITRRTASQLAEEINTALQGLAEKYGVSIHAGNVRYATDNMSVKVEVAVKSPEGVTLTREFTDLMDSLPFLDLGGLTADEIKGGVVLNHPRVPGGYKVIGYRTRASAKPIMIEAVAGGKRLVTTEGFIRASTKKVA